MLSLQSLYTKIEDVLYMTEWFCDNLKILQIDTGHTYQCLSKITLLIPWSIKRNWIGNCRFLYIKLVDHVIDIEWIVSFHKNNDCRIFHFESCYRNSWESLRTTFHEYWNWHNQYKITIIKINKSIGTKTYLARYFVMGKPSFCTENIFI